MTYDRFFSIVSRMELKDYREVIGKTQRECAGALGITTIYYSEIERKVREPGKNLTRRIIEWSGGEVQQSDLWPEWDKCA